MDGPGAVLPELHTLALPTPLRKEGGTRFLLESTQGREREADTCTLAGKRSTSANGRTHDTLTDSLGRRPWTEHWLPGIYRVRFQRLTSGGKGRASVSSRQGSYAL